MDFDAKPIIVVGGGPAGLMAAEVISQAGLCVHLFDSMPSLGRKFLMAGKSGLNLTHSEPYEDFLNHYRDRHVQLESFLRVFGPAEVREWASGLGIETFTGTSGRVFPTGMKASPLLRNWLRRLSALGVSVHLRHNWNGWNEHGALRFITPDGTQDIWPRATILALGGGSWARLGSTGTWVSWLREAGIPVETLKPSNCGFDVAWTEHFRERFEGQPVKSVVLRFKGFEQRGEFVITRHGIEGSLIYAVSSPIRDEIETQGQAFIELDLTPDRPVDYLVARLSRPRGSRSFSSHLEKSIGLRGVKASLIRESLPKSALEDPARLATAIKALRIPLLAARPLDEAISSAGGISFAALDERLMLRARPGVFCAGEMLDWDAPTGGYLITACLSTGRAAGLGLLGWLEEQGLR